MNKNQQNLNKLKVFKIPPALALIIRGTLFPAVGLAVGGALDFCAGAAWGLHRPCFFLPPGSKGETGPH